MLEETPSDVQMMPIELLVSKRGKALPKWTFAGPNFGVACARVAAVGRAQLPGLLDSRLARAPTLLTRLLRLGSIER